MSETDEVNIPLTDINEQKPTVAQSDPESRAAERKVENRDEPIRPETVDGISKLMQGLPRRGDAYAFQIPYRTERRMPTEGVLDEETGLYVEAAYNPEDKISSLRASPGLTIVLSTPPLHENDASGQLDKMTDALKRIYTESPNLEKEIEYTRHTINTNNLYDRVKFELFHDEGGPVLNGVSPTSGKEQVAIKWWEKSPSMPVSESGGLFLKGILERVTQEQIEEAEKNKLLTELTIEKVKDEAVPNDKERVYEYAYHATERSNIPGISELGFQPSGSESKESGTIFFTGWDSATSYLPKREGEGVLYRFHVADMLEIAKSWHFDNNEGLSGIGHSIPTDKPIPPERLDFNLDAGKTWMPAIPRMKEAA